MKKLFLLAFAMCLSTSVINAQVFVGNSNEQVTTESLTKKTTNTTTTEQAATGSNKKYKSITDYAVDLNFDSKIYGFSVGGDNVNFQMAFGEDIYSATLGIGFGGTHIGNGYLIKGRLYPYAGYGSYGDDSEFLYGAAANISLGVKVWTTKKGNSAYLTFGYQVIAPEFETSNMFDNGSWGVGLSIVSF